MLFRWVKANKTILVNAGSLIGTTAITSGLGFAYWWVAARRFPPEAIGFASAIISTMSLLGSFAMLGMGTLLIGELPRQRGKELSLISTALVLVGGVGACSGIVYAFTMSNLSAAFHILGASIGNTLLFALGVSLTAITLVLDQALIGLLRGELQLWRNGIFALVKLAALFLISLWLSQVTGLSIYATWIIGMICSLLALLGIALVKCGSLRGASRPQWEWLRKLGPAALKHHILNLTLDAPSLLLPMVVTLTLSATVNAWFYVAWSLSGVANTASAALATTLYAVGAAQPAALARKMRLTVSLALVACLLANCVLLFAPTQVLTLFGHSYSEQAAWSLRVLSLESFPFIIKNHYIALSRIRGQLPRTILITAGTGLLELSAAAIGAHLGGLNGLSLGWLAAMSIEAVCMFPTVYRAMRFAKVVPETFVELDMSHTEAIEFIDTLALSTIQPEVMEKSTHNYQMHVQPRSKVHVSYSGSGDRLPRPTRLQRLAPANEKNLKLFCGCR